MFHRRGRGGLRRAKRRDWLILRPTAAKRLVERHQRVGGRLARRDASLFDVEFLPLGVEVVGGIPHFERSMAEGARSVRELCEIAAAKGLRVDMHCDETDDPLSRHIEA